MALKDWSTTAASNTNAATGVNFDENQAPSTVNNSARELMAQVAAGNGRILLASGSASGATLDIVMTSYTGFLHKELIVSLIPATDNVDLLMRFSTDGGSNYDTAASNYNWAANGAVDGGGGGVSALLADSSAEGQTAFVLNSSSQTVGNGASEGIAATILIYETTNAALQTRVSWEAIWMNTTAKIVNGGGVRAAAQDTDAVRLLFSSGNIASGTYRLYGLR